MKKKFHQSQIFFTVIYEGARGQLLTVVVVNDLEVFHRGLRDASVEVQHVGLRVVVPHGGLVVQLDEVFHGVILPPAEEALLLLSHIHSV